MAYTIKYHGYDVKCDTVEEVQALLGANKPTAAAPNNQRTLQLQPATNSVGTLVGKLSKEQRELLRHIVNEGGAVTRQRLRELVGVGDPHQFAGILIGISKFAQNMGMDSPVASTFERENSTGPRVYQYKIRPSMKAEVKEALNKPQVQ